MKGDTGANSVSISLRAGLITVQGAGLTRIGNSTSSQQQVTYSNPGDLVLDCDFTPSQPKGSPPTNDTITITSVYSSSTTIKFGNGADSATFVYCTIGDPAKPTSPRMILDGGAKNEGNRYSLVGTKVYGGTTGITNFP